MHYFKDLQKTVENRKFSIGTGILFIVIAISWILIQRKMEDPLIFSDWIYSFLFALNGLSYISRAMGYPFERIFGRAYVLVNENEITVKPGTFDKKVTCRWNEIIAMEYHAGSYKITRYNNDVQLVSLRRLTYATIQDMNKVISNLAKKKRISAYATTNQYFVGGK